MTVLAPTVEEMAHLEAQLTLVLGLAAGIAMRQGEEGVQTLRLLVDLDHAKKLARDNPDGMMAALQRKYGGLKVPRPGAELNL